MAKKNLFLGMSAMLLALGMGLIGCASTATSSVGSVPVGTWRFSDLSGTFIIEIGVNGSGSFTLFDFDGNTPGSSPVAADGNGRIKIGQANARYTLADVVVGGKYLGESMAITGLLDNTLHFHKTKPSQSISLGCTSWNNPRGLPITYIFNDDGSFRIDLGPHIQGANDALWNADTEGTYTIDGIDITLNYPNGRALKWTATSDGGISGGMEQTGSQHIFIEGPSFLLGYAVFGLSE